MPGKLPSAAYDALRRRRIEVRYAGRWTISLWNREVREPDLKFYAGWYWSEPASDWIHGPFKSEGAAVRDACEVLGLLGGGRDWRQGTQAPEPLSGAAASPARRAGLALVR